MDSDSSSSRSRLEEAVVLLVPAREILDKFNYKHKNQHRLSKWWTSFDMLRRHTAKFCRDEIRPALDALTKRDLVQSKRKQSKRQRTEPYDEDITAGAVAKARWMADYLIPKAYIAITQLAADNQFAHLGLLLLGVLAQVHSAVSLLLPAEQELEEETVVKGKEVDVGVVVPRLEQGKEVCPRTSLKPTPKTRDDLGEAVMRDNLDAKERDSTSHKSMENCDEAVGTFAVERKRPDRGKRKMDVARSSGLELPAGQTPAKPKSVIEESPNHKIKTARKEDAVVSSEKPKKKKKRKKDDEFDNLFSSLM